MRLSASSLLLLVAPGCSAISFQEVPQPNLDLAQLGRVALAGNFDSISLYQYVGQSEDGLKTNGSQSLLGRYPSGAFAQLEAADANIRSMCPFVMNDGTLAGVVVVGNFTSLGGNQAQAAVLYDPSKGTVTPLPGIDGQISTVYCDQAMSTVFFGGSFTGLNSTNAIAWTTGWTNLPFAGFNGPVSAINLLPNGNVVFAGSFTGLGNSTLPSVPDAQVVNVGAATISSSPTTSNTDYQDPRNIICKTNTDTGPGNSWILPDNTTGYWQATFPFGFEPTKIRLYNSKVSGYGTKTWRFIAQPLGGILNLTYTDPSTGQLTSCTNKCHLPNDNSTYIDFHFVNVIGMNGFQLAISDWYGQGAGLGGIELFQNDIFSFAISEYNEPVCDHVSSGANATSTGSWTAEPSLQSTSGYLSTYLPSGTTADPPSESVVFQPDIKQSGNYSITVYTPGCLADNSCNTRGQVEISGIMGSPTGSAAQSFATTLYQTNYYDKYDQVFYGYVEANSDSFRPTVTLTPLVNQSFPLTVVAQRIGFTLSASTGNGGLNGLYEYNPNLATINMQFSLSAINRAGMKLDSGAQINTLEVDNNITYVGGHFASQTVTNIFALVNDVVTALPGGGLNDAVTTMILDGGKLFVGGNFTNTQDNSEKGLSNLAAYSTIDHSWSALGAGVNGIVHAILPVIVNTSATQTEDCLAISGAFNEVFGFSSYAAFSVDGIALWVPSQSNWLHNVDSIDIGLSGMLSAYTAVPGSTPLWAGALQSQNLGISGVVTLSTSDTLEIQQLPINIKSHQGITPSESAINSHHLVSRATINSTTSGVVTGIFYTGDGLNITILGGHFTATATNGSTLQNLALIYGSQSDIVTGLASNDSIDAAVLAMDVSSATLIAGGSINNGVLLYDLVRKQLSDPQPPALTGQGATVYAVAAQPDSSSVYVGGSFAQAGSFNCPALCIYNTNNAQWVAPASGLAANSTVYSLMWASSTSLIISGNLTVHGKAAPFVSYDTKTRKYTLWSGAQDSKAVPGTITSMATTSIDYTSFWAAGTATNGSVFLSKYDAGSWTPISTLLGSRSRIMGLQMLPLSVNDGSSKLVSSSQNLLVTGSLILPNFGNASAALFDGQHLRPFILATLADGTPGSISHAFVQNPQNLLINNSHSYLALGFIVLISLAIALALIFLLVIFGILAERIRRRREGYVPAPTRYIPAGAAGYSYTDEKKKKKTAISPPYGVRRDLPPEQLFAGVGAAGAMPGTGIGARGEKAEASSFVSRNGSGSRPGSSAAS